MALQISFTDGNTGVQAPSSYVRVDPPAIGNSVTVTRYYNAAAGGLAPIQSRTFTLPPGVITAIQNAIVAQLYNYLKTLPEFTGAIDA